MSRGSGERLLGAVVRGLLDALLGGKQSSRRQPAKLRSTPQTASRPAPGSTPRSTTSSQAERLSSADDASPGQYGTDATRDLAPAEIRALRPSYEPHPDGDPDPGEIVWTWVPYAENDGRGKDRPVLIIARIDARTTAGCYLSTKQHRGFVSVGRGPWDSQGRESFLSPERVLRVTDAGMRREGHVLPRESFARAVDSVLRTHGIARS
ncbi:MAG: hypothetical protein ACK5LO_14075 [Leucobacter sp.]